jgi:microcystin-dependent protein
MHQGTGPDGTTFQIGEQGGVEQVTLTTQQIPNHTHPMMAAAVSAQDPQPAGKVPAQTITVQPYLSDTGQVPLNANSVGIAGGSQPHENMQPYLGINFIISLFGIFPSQT